MQSRIKLTDSRIIVVSFFLTLEEYEAACNQAASLKNIRNNLSFDHGLNMFGFDRCRVAGHGAVHRRCRYGAYRAEYSHRRLMNKIQRIFGKHAGITAAGYYPGFYVDHCFVFWQTFGQH